MEKTGLLSFFDDVISSHDFRLPKEHPEFWNKLNEYQPFAKEATVLIDDSLAVLRSARDYAIKHLISISRPDSGMPKREIEEFNAIEDFRVLMPGL
jgi:putative hydrolase of the HAD superfamily